MGNQKHTLSKNDLLYLLLVALSKPPNKKQEAGYIKLFNELLFGFSLSFLTYGVTEVISGNEYAPHIIATGFLLLAARVIFDDRIKSLIFHWNKIIGVLILIFIGFVFYFAPLVGFQIITQNQLEKITESNINWADKLIPGNGGVPSRDERIIDAFMNDKYIVMLGNGSAIFMDDFETFSLTSESIPYLSVTTDSDGLLLLTTQILDSEGHEVIKVTNNKFAATRYAYNPLKPDLHTLIVRDSRKKEVLNVNYINKKILRIVGTFYLEGKHPVIISPNGTVQIAGNTIKHLYGSGNKIIDIVSIAHQQEGIK